MLRVFHSTLIRDFKVGVMNEGAVPFVPIRAKVTGKVFGFCRT